MAKLDQTWKRARGFSAYDVSDKGGVRQHDTQLELKPHAGPSGIRYIVIVSDAGKRCNMTVAALVLRTFVGAPKGGKDRAVHGPRGKDCDYLSNLSYGDRKDQLAAMKKRDPDRYAGARGNFGGGRKPKAKTGEQSPVRNAKSNRSRAA